MDCRILLTCIIPTIVVRMSMSTYLQIVVADKINPNVYGVDEKPFGFPYKKWAQNWWQWYVSIPDARTHPGFVYSPEKCGLNQAGPVWFLVDKAESGSEVRSCEIPFGKAIIFAVLSGECDFGDIEEKTDAALLRCASEGNDYTQALGTWIDNVPLKNIESYSITTPFFNITMPENNIFDEPSGKYRSVINGYFVFLKPLSIGNHTIRFVDTVNNPQKPDYNHQKDTSYKIVVKPDSQ